MDISLVTVVPLTAESGNVGGLETGTVLIEPLAGDELLDAAVVSDAVVRRSDEGSAMDDISVGEDDSSVHVSETEVTDKVLDSDGPVVAYVRLGTYEPVLLGLSCPGPAVSLEPGLVPPVGTVTDGIDDKGIVASAEERVLLLSGRVVNCAPELGLSRTVISALEMPLAPEGRDVGTDKGAVEGANEEDSKEVESPLVRSGPEVLRVIALLVTGLVLVTVCAFVWLSLVLAPDVV